MSQATETEESVSEAQEIASEPPEQGQGTTSETNQETFQQEEANSKQKTFYLKIRFIVGFATLLTGLWAANLALFHWVERIGLYYLLGEYARYVCAYGGFSAMIFGAMLVNDYLVHRNVFKKKDKVVIMAGLESPLRPEIEKVERTQRITNKGRENIKKTIAGISLTILLLMSCPVVVYSVVSYTATVIITPTNFEYGRAFKSSEVGVSTASGTPVDDAEAILNISLEKASQVFIIYNAGNKPGSTEDSDGKGCAINIDGEDVAFSWQSPYIDNKANSVTVAYATNLTAGSHTIKGRFFANYPGYTVTIDTRQIVAYWFPNVVASYVRSTVQVNTKSTTPVDDPQAAVTFTLSENSVAFIIYNAGNKRGSTEASAKGVTLNIDGTDISTRQWQSPYAADKANSVTIVYAVSLAPGSHTVKGKFFSMASGKTVTIDERQLIVFCFPASLVKYWFKESATAVSTSSGSPVDDTEAVLSGTLSQDSILAIYTGGNSGATEHFEGKGALLNVDGSDRSSSVSWQSPYSSNYPNSVTSLWSVQLTAGSHTVKGRFFSNLAGNTVTIANRQLVVLSFSG